MKNYQALLVFALLTIFISCEEKEKDTEPLFRLLSTQQTGIDFSNDLSFDEEFNVYTYRNYYNGGGVSIGDINNDGLPDLYFTANLKENKLYLNKGNFQFEDITDQSGTAGNKAWSTGVTMVDVNADGWLDIYVCNSGDIEGDNKQNELFINNQDLTFTESAESFNLDNKGYSTHASFFDYDKDGDLDVYLLNNSYQSIGSFNLKKNERPKRDNLGGDKLLRNDDGQFTDVSVEAGIYGSVIGFGLGVTVGDVNGDLWDDIYVSNDFFERDYLYINQQNGTFSEELTGQMNSISAASMGADMADINNDGRNDLFVTEMLPGKYERLKTVTTFEDWNRYQYNVQNGYYHQFTRNTFQLNNGNNTFSEVGRFSGVEATDWSWGALIFDMDNDGMKDLFVANGIYQDLTDQDYLQYISNEEVVKSIVQNNRVDYKKLIEIIPSNPISNYAFMNRGGLQFEDQTEQLGLSDPGFSNGSAYGDLDNDGDLDLVVNNVNMEAFVYENRSNDLNGNSYIKLELKGDEKNPFAVGSKIWITAENAEYYAELQPTRGFQSSMDFRPNFGTGSNSAVDITVVWPLGQITNIKNVEVNQILKMSVAESSGESKTVGTEEDLIFKQTEAFLPITHKENTFIDFHRDRLVYHMKSTEGPKLSVADVNSDGIPDLYVGGAKESPGALVVSSGNEYRMSSSEVFDADKNSEDQESLFFDADNDGDLDLYVCSGGVESSTASLTLGDRLYLNDGKGNFTSAVANLAGATGQSSSSTVSVSDFDQDGDLDLFVGERGKPFSPGIPGDGFLLENNGGKFKNVTKEKAPELENIGIIMDSEFVDIDNDNDQDLIVIGEYMSPKILVNKQGNFSLTQNSFDNLKGWWKTLEVSDIDGDGDQDLLLGNLGENSRFKASKEQPIILYVYDFDGNGSLDPILAGSNGEQFYPFALRHNLIDQIKSLKKKYPDYNSFQNATMVDIFGQESLDKALKLEITNLSSVILVNEGNMDFKVVNLPVEAQLSPIYAFSTGDYDKDGDIDIILGGNLFGVKPEIGRYDASYGTYLENQGGLLFTPRQKGFQVKGQIRDIVTLDQQVIVSRNNDSIVIFEY